MRFRLSLVLPTLALVCALSLAACGSGTASGGGTGASPTATTAPAPTSTPPPAPTATTPTSTAVVATATAMVGGKSETILTSAQGLTLYYFTPDTSASSACTGSCANTWPALTFSGPGAPTAASSLPGTLTAAQTASGRQQVEYNGHPLYMFAGDSKAGDTNGQGILGKWFVATPSLSKM